MALTRTRRIGRHPTEQKALSIGPTAKAISELKAQGLSLPNLPAMYRYTLGRITEQLKARDLGGILLFDPINIRYATGSQNMQVCFVIFGICFDITSFKWSEMLCDC